MVVDGAGRLSRPPRARIDPLRPFVLEEADLPVSGELLLVVAWTLLAGIALHGATAYLLSERYATWFGVHGEPDMPEAVEVEMMATR